MELAQGDASERAGFLSDHDVADALDTKRHGRAHALFAVTLTAGLILAVGLTSRHYFVTLSSADIVDKYSKDDFPKPQPILKCAPGTCLTFHPPHLGLSWEECLTSCNPKDSPTFGYNNGLDKNCHCQIDCDILQGNWNWDPTSNIGGIGWTTCRWLDTLEIKGRWVPVRVLTGSDTSGIKTGTTEKKGWKVSASMTAGTTVKGVDVSGSVGSEYSKEFTKSEEATVQHAFKQSKGKNFIWQWVYTTKVQDKEVVEVTTKTENFVLTESRNMEPRCLPGCNDPSDDQYQKCNRVSDTLKGESYTYYKP